MESVVKPIAIVQGADSAAIQRLFADFTERLQPHARIAGAIEVVRGDLRTIGGAGGYRLFQDLGAGASGCALDATGVVEACEDICRDIADGCDLVVLSKFGKLEAENRTGLLSAFAAAMAADIPILTAVSPRHAEAWSRFADPLFVTLPPDPAALAGWWEAVRPSEQRPSVAL